MKCVVGLLFLAVCAFESISASPVRNGMVFYQSQPEYYNAHRAFIMQYASQPYKTVRRRNGQAAGVSAFASGKKISAKTYLKRTGLVDDEEQAAIDASLDGASHSVAEAYPTNDEVPFADEPAFVPVAADVPEDVPEDVPTHVVPDNNKKTPVQLDEEDDDDDDDVAPLNPPQRSRNSPPAGSTYFPVTFGSTNGGAIAIANSYSTGKGGSATSRATAYGSPAKSSRRRVAQQ